MEVSTTAANLKKFLSENSFFLFAYSYFSPSILGAPLETSCFIKPSAVEEFKRLIKSLEISTENEAVATYWKLKSGLEFFSTIFGTVFILDLTPDKDQYFENKGFKILYPESSKKIIEENGDKVFASRYIKTRLEEYTKEKIEEIFKIREEKKKETEAAYKLFREKEQLFIKFLVDQNPKAENLAKRLWNFDIFYSYSDDHFVYRRGVETERMLKEELVEFGFDAKDVFSRLFDLKKFEK